MSKVVKAVAIGALIGLTGGLLLPVLLLPAPFAAGAFGLTGLAAAAAGTAFYAGLGAVASYFVTKKAANLSTTQERLRVTVDAQAEGKWVFGETAFGTDVIYAENHGAKDEYISYIVCAAAHKVESFDTLYVNDELVTFSGNAATGLYADTLWMQTRTGTEVQSSILPISADGLSWPLTADGLGMAHYQLRWKLGKDKTKSGIPTRVTLIGKGGPVYDPRLDTTVGGSGSHRANDQTTWQYSNGADILGGNWALVVLFYLLGWRNNGELVFGVGINPADIDYDQAIAAANVCDEVIDTKPRFRIGGIFTTSNNHEEVLSQLEASIGGSIAFIGGKYYIWAPNDDIVPYLAIGNTDIIRNAGIEFIPSGPLSDLYNTGRGRYISPEDLYQPIMYPDVVESTAVTQDGRARIMSRDLAVVQDVSIAERVVRHMVRRSRFTGTWRFSMGPKGLLFKPFDVTTLNCLETDNNDVNVRIINMVFSTSGIVQLECIEEDSSIYDTAAPLGFPITQNDPSALDPATKIALTGLGANAITITGSAGTSAPAYEIFWNDPGEFVERTEIQYKPTAGSVWTILPSINIEITTAIIRNFEPLTEYVLRARHVTIFGLAGDWVSITDTTHDAGLTYYNDIPHYYYQSTAPSGVGEKDNDLWVDSDTNVIYRRIASSWTEIRDDGIGQALVDAATALTVANGRILTFFSTTPPTAEAVGDLWFDTDDGNKLYRWNGTSWALAQDDLIGTAIGAAADAQATADGKIFTWAQTSPPTADGIGDFWLDTDDNNRLYRWNGSSWTDYIQDQVGRSHAVTGGNAHGTTLAQVTSLMSASGATVVSGVGNDYRMETTSSNVTFKHSLASLTSVGAYAGTLRTGLFVGANGITMGFNRKADGVWIDSITLNGTTGKATFKDDIVTSGQVFASGNTSLGGNTYAIVGIGVVRGIYGEGPGVGVLGYASGLGKGVYGEANHAAGYGVWGYNFPGIAVGGYGSTGGSFTGTSLGIVVSGASTFNEAVTLTSTTANMSLGNATLTGNANFCIKQGLAGAKTSGQYQIYGANSSGSKTTLGLVVFEDVVAGTGPFVGYSQIKIFINAVEYWLPLKVV